MPEMEEVEPEEEESDKEANLEDDDIVQMKKVLDNDGLPLGINEMRRGQL